MKNKLIEFKEKGLALLQSLKSKITDKIQATDSNQTSNENSNTSSNIWAILSKI